MGKKVFFSFHYDQDIFRVNQVRNSWIIRPENQSQPFVDKAEWESIKGSSENGIENWIEQQLKGTSVTIVLIGEKTSTRDWVKHEIKRSVNLGKGLLGIYIHNIKVPISGCSLKGKNPLDSMRLKSTGQCLSEIYHTYDWVHSDGYNNISRWIDHAANISTKKLT